jgi:hypothetical protein
LAQDKVHDFKVRIQSAIKRGWSARVDVSAEYVETYTVTATDMGWEWVKAR